MRKIILFFSIALSSFSTLYAQPYNGIVLATYNDSVYMNSLNGAKVQLPDSFLEEISRFNIISYEQNLPFSKNNFLKTIITFYCKDNTIEFVEYLTNHAAHLFSNVGYELAHDELKPEYDPIDY